MPSPTRFKQKSRGFTLTELMIVVGIIGALATIAIPNFLRFQLKAKSSEAKTNIASIRMAEITYHANNSHYVSATVSPNSASSPAKMAFVQSAGFTSIGWEPEGNTFFTYGVAVGGAGQWFHATAHGNLDGNAVSQMWHFRRGNVESETHLGAAPVTCGAASGLEDNVEPCDMISGRTEF